MELRIPGSIKFLLILVSSYVIWSYAAWLHIVYLTEAPTSAAAYQHGRALGLGAIFYALPLSFITTKLYIRFFTK